jgi:repressor LexA
VVLEAQVQTGGPVTGLTERQQAVLDFIRQHIKSVGYPPTRAEVAVKFGFSSANAAEQHLRALETKGRISIARGTSRGIVVLPKRKQKSPTVATMEREGK